MRAGQILGVAGWFISPGTALGLVLSAMGFIGGVVASLPWVFVVLIAAALFALGAFVANQLSALRVRHQSRKPGAETEEEESQRIAFEAELIAILDQADELDHLKGFDVHYGSYCFWKEKTIDFLCSVLGPRAEREFKDQDGFDGQRAWLADLLSSPERWQLQGNVRKAAKCRREASQADRIRLVGGPWEGDYA